MSGSEFSILGEILLKLCSLSSPQNESATMTSYMQIVEERISGLAKGVGKFN